MPGAQGSTAWKAWVALIPSSTGPQSFLCLSVLLWGTFIAPVSRKGCSDTISSHLSTQHLAPRAPLGRLWVPVSRGTSWSSAVGDGEGFFQWPRGKQVHDPALGWVLLPVALRAAAPRLPTSPHAADASPERVLSMTVPARSKTDAFKEGEKRDLGLRIPWEGQDGRATAAPWGSIPVAAICKG